MDLLTHIHYIPNLLLPQNRTFSLLGFDLSTECGSFHRLVTSCRESVPGIMC